MAHYLAGTATGPGAAGNFLDQLVAHLITNGWTKLWGVASTNAMMKGAALDTAAGNAPYLWISVSSSTTIVFQPYFDADVAAQVGIATTGVVPTLNVQDASFPFWIRCNAVSVAFAVKAGTIYNKGYAGYLRRGLPSQMAGMTSSTGAIAAGATNIPTASDMTGKLLVGQKVLLANQGHSNSSANKTNAELVTIQTITGGATPSITLTAGTTKAYDTGALIGTHVHCPVSLVANASGTSFSTQMYAACDGVGTVPASTALSSGWSVLVEATGNADPSDDTGWFGAGVFVADNTPVGKSGSLGTLYHALAFATNGTPAAEDILNDGLNTYLVVGTYTTTPGLALGPREN